MREDYFAHGGQGLRKNTLSTSSYASRLLQRRGNRKAAGVQRFTPITRIQICDRQCQSHCTCAKPALRRSKPAGMREALYSSGHRLGGGLGLGAGRVRVWQ